METLLDLEGAARFLNLTPGQVYEQTRSRYRMKQANPLPVIRIGKHLRFKLSSLQEWVTTLENRHAA